MKSFTALAGIVLFILALVFSLDLFLFPGRSITFDAHIHMTTFSQFAQALQDGEFPVRWADNFANYGLPLPLFAHQTTAYAGALLTLLFGSPVLAYNVLVFLGALLSTVLLYKFLRYSVEPWPALLGTALFAVAPYRIVNVYIRGALPEFISLIFLPWILIGVHQSLVQKRWLGLVNVGVATALLALTHPMLLLISCVVIVPYSLFTAWPWMKNWKPLAALGGIAALGVGVASFYILPLLYDIRYTNYGSAGPEFASNSFLNLTQLFSESWSYFGPSHPGPRSVPLIPGVPEMAIFLFAVLVTAWLFLRHKQPAKPFVLWTGIGFLALLLLLPVSSLLYQYVPFLGKIQFPWRMLSAFLIVPPVLFALLIQRFRAAWVGLIIISAVLLWRIPQLYGKNYLDYDLQNYAFTTANLHTNNMSTLWMGDPTKYPVQSEKLQVISGESELQLLSRKNASREYRVTASVPTRLVEYTFYFPGWMVYVDGQPVPVEFQDAEYRGVMTFEVPAGEHTVNVRFEDTKVRQLGLALSVASLIVGGVWILAARRFLHLK